MKFIDVFNGDADGLCALMQMRLSEPCSDAELVTGVKRDNALLRRVTAAEGDRILALDITFDSNRADVARLLAAGASIRYVDHHAPGELIEHPNLHLTIDESPLVCTSLLVNRALDGQCAVWAVVGAYGDNLPQVADELAVSLGWDAVARTQLRALGELLNYNGYGSVIEDLHFHPAQLFRLLEACGDPFGFMETPEFVKLRAGHAADMEAAQALLPTHAQNKTAIYSMPDAAWARRVIGVWANGLSQAYPERAHLIFCPDGNGSYTASLRAARARPYGAADFCRGFPGGGGRAAAGGINRLPGSELDIVGERFVAAFS